MLDKIEALKVFCTAAETLQFKETAIRLAVSPPVITRMMAAVSLFSFMWLSSYLVIRCRHLKAVMVSSKFINCYFIISKIEIIKRIAKCIKK